jgi:hypothetical protein
MPPCQSKKEGWIRWRGSKAQAVLMQDLIEGILPIKASRVTGEGSWEIYKTVDAFSTNLVFKQL